MVYLYMVMAISTQGDIAIKIGKTDNINERLIKYSCCSPYIRLLSICKVRDKKREFECHRYLASKGGRRLEVLGHNTEWYEFNGSSKFASDCINNGFKAIKPLARLKSIEQFTASV